jgi:hypothetical protein
MKKYKINNINSANMHWKFAGSTDNYKERVELFEIMKGRDGVKGLRITDTETNKVIYEKIS